MAFNGLKDFAKHLETTGDLKVVEASVDTNLEITEIADRCFKEGRQALLFTNNGTGSADT